jgi:hypothetical protein
MTKTLTRLTIAAAVLFAAGSAFAQQAGSGPQPQMAPNTQGGSPQTKGTQGTMSPMSPSTTGQGQRNGTGMQQLTPGPLTRR